MYWNGLISSFGSCGAAVAAVAAATGAQRQFTRRKQDAVCIQGGDYKRPQPTSTPCACSASDVECDYGYVAGTDGACKPLPKVDATCPTCLATGYKASESMFLA
jgi:hypothetical protein